MTDQSKHAPPITGRLENWSTEPVNGTEMIVWGRIYGDTKGRFHDGAPIHTSGTPIRQLSPGDLLITRNSVYELGQPVLGEVWTTEINDSDYPPVEKRG